ncbi:MAG: DUF177 domain-containing protein [Pseudomonadota bacterium]
MSEDDRKNPFSVPVNVRTLPRKGQQVRHEASEDERAALAGLHDLIAVESWRGECLLTPWKRDGVQLVGEVKAKIVQPCAVTLEPLHNEISEEFDLIFVPEGSKLALPHQNQDGELVFDADGDDLPETFTGDTIDLANVWLEFFSLAIDPFARHESADLDKVLTSAGVDPNESSPFAALSALKKH